MWVDHKVTILCGSSGVGKTSVLQAGAIPLLQRQEVAVIPVGRVSYRLTFPMAALPDQNPYSFALLASWDPEESPTRISGLTISDFLRRHRSIDRHGRSLPLLIAIDQAEPIFRGAKQSPRWRQRFVTELGDALRSQPHAHLLISIRDEYLEDALAVAGTWTDQPPAEFSLKALEPDAAIEAVMRPVERYGRRIQDDAARDLVADLAGLESAGASVLRRPSRIEPALLQVVCRALWEALPSSAIDVSKKLITQYGDATSILSSFYAEALTTIAVDYKTSFQRVHSWMRNSVLAGTVSDDIRPSDGVIRALEDAHLIRVRRLEGDPSCELLHPRLAESVRSVATASSPIELSSRAYLTEAGQALFRREFDLAWRHVEAAVEASSDKDIRLRAEAASMLGNVAYEGDQPEIAEREYTAAARLFETLQDTAAVGRLLAAVGRIKLIQGEWSAAVHELRAAVNRLPNDPIVQISMGQALWHAGQVEAALGVLEGVLTRHGQSSVALQARGEILADLGKAESALRDLNRVDHLAGPSTRSARALALAELSHIDAAKKELDDVLTNGGSGPVLLRAAQVYKLSGAAQPAQELARRSLRATHPPLPAHQRDDAILLLEQA